MERKGRTWRASKRAWLGRRRLTGRDRRAVQWWQWRWRANGRKGGGKVEREVEKERGGGGGDGGDGRSASTFLERRLREMAVVAV